MPSLRPKRPSSIPSLSAASGSTYLLTCKAASTRRTQSLPACSRRAANSLTSTTTADGLQLSWTAPASGMTPAFYRIYRDGTTVADRYSATGSAALSWTDKDPSSGHQYWVTAVDNKFAESSPVGPVTP